MTKEQKAKIDAMSHKEMCRIWRHAPAGDLMFQGEAGNYFTKRLNALGGFVPAISKELGW